LPVYKNASGKAHNNRKGPFAKNGQGVFARSALRHTSPL